MNLGYQVIILICIIIGTYIIVRCIQFQQACKKESIKLDVIAQYIATKLMYIEKHGRYGVAVLEDRVCIAIKEEVNDRTYTTLIYFEKDGLYELYIEHSTQKLDWKKGERVMEVEDATFVQGKKGNVYIERLSGIKKGHFNRVKVLKL